MIFYMNFAVFNFICMSIFIMLTDIIKTPRCWWRHVSGNFCLLCFHTL